MAEAVTAGLKGELVDSAVNLGVARVPDAARLYLSLAERLGTIFRTFSRGLPRMLTVVASGRLAQYPVGAFALGALKGAFQGLTEERVTYVNAATIAETHGVKVREAATEELDDYQSLLQLSGEVEGELRSLSGTVMARKGLVLTEVDGYEIEFPLTRYMLLIRNEDVPGVIGHVGTILGNAGVNIADMSVGRQHDKGGAMMGISLDNPVPPGVVDDLLTRPNIAAARFIELG